MLKTLHGCQTHTSRNTLCGLAALTIGMLLSVRSVAVMGTPSCGSCVAGYGIPGSDLPDIPYLKIKASHFDLNLQQHTKACLSGHASVYWHQTTMQADRICLVRNRSGAIQSIDAKRAVQLQAPGLLVSGQSLKIQQRSPKHVHITIQTPSAHFLDHKKGVIWHAKASTWTLDDKTRWSMTNAVLSTCALTQPYWSFKATQLIVDRQQCMMTLQHPRWVLGQHLSLPLPTLHYPMGIQSRNGFLLPNVKTNRYVGLQVQLPFYMRLSPSQDLKWFLGSSQKTGLSLGLQGRWLTAQGLWQWYGFRVFNDRAWSAYQNTLWQQWSSVATPAQQQALAAVTPQRDAWRLRFDSNPAALWQYHLDWSHWSDDYMLPQYHPLALASNNLRVNRQLSMARTFQHWQATAQWNRPATLSLLDYPKSQPVYAWTPRVETSGLWQSGPHSWFSWFSQATRFRLYQAAPSDTRLREATRLVITPQWTWQQQASHGQWQVHAGLHAVLTDQVGREDEAVVPWLTVKRHWWWSLTPSRRPHAWQWYVEPSLMFHVAPKVQQDHLPLLDTDATSLDTLSILDDRRFLGFDRYGDAEDVTLAWTNHWQPPNADAPVLTWQWARRALLKTHRVCLTPSCATTWSVPIDRMTYMHMRYQPTMPLSMSVSGYLADHGHRWPWYAGDVHWDGQHSQVHLGYRHQRIQAVAGDFKKEAWWLAQFQRHFGHQWQLEAGVAVVDPNEKNDRFLHIGLGQKKPCWSWSVHWASVLRKAETLSLQSRDNRFTLNVSLTGLGSIGKV